MKIQIHILVSLLPILAASQSPSQRSFNDLCGSGQTTGTNTYNGVQYKYHCNHRSTSFDSASLENGHDDPATCVNRASHSSASVGVTWLQDGRCALATAGPPVADAGYIFFEKVPPSTTCCVERDDFQTKYQACELARNQLQSQLDACRAAGTSPSTGGPSTGGGRVPDCKSVTGVQGYSNQSQSGSRWSVNCNVAGGAGSPITRPADTVASLPECVDKCAGLTECKVAQLLPQSRNNCVLFRSQGAFTPQTGTHFAGGFNATLSWVHEWGVRPERLRLILHAHQASSSGFVASSEEMSITESWPKPA
ncbi:hypothetical protein F1880_004644 [Penicillium rolfsii]|nr:hypothetical protein F1880_004644 [Penicillium rolfsii]